MNFGINVKGRPMWLEIRRSERIILDAIEPSVTFTELWKRTKLSTSTLSKYLKKLKEQKFIERVYDPKTGKLLYRLSKKALKPGEVFLRELDRLCTEPFPLEVSAGLKRPLTDQVWSEMLRVADRVKFRDEKLYGDVEGGLFHTYLRHLNSQPYRALAGLWIYHVERDYLSEFRKRLESSRKSKPKKGVAIAIWDWAKVEKVYRKGEGLIALPFVKKAGLERKFDGLLAEFEKLPLSPPAKLLHAEVMEEHTNYLESLVFEKVHPTIKLERR